MTVAASHTADSFGGGWCSRRRRRRRRRRRSDDDEGRSGRSTRKQRYIQLKGRRTVRTRCQLSGLGDLLRRLSGSVNTAEYGTSSTSLSLSRQATTNKLLRSSATLQQPKCCVLNPRLWGHLALSTERSVS
jgi:hypothetical protein